MTRLAGEAACALAGCALRGLRADCGVCSNCRYFLLAYHFAAHMEEAAEPDGPSCWLKDVANSATWRRSDTARRAALGIAVGAGAPWRESRGLANVSCHVGWAAEDVRTKRVEELSE